MNLLPIFISMKKNILPILFAVSIFFISCSGSKNCMNTEKINIEYYSEGGFTGGASGVTIGSTGNADFWRKNLNGLKEKIKSISVDGEKLKKICSLLKNPEIFSYKNKFKGNYTTYLILNLNGEESKMSFNKSDLPDDMPEPLKELIHELNNINK